MKAQSLAMTAVVAALLLVAAVLTVAPDSVAQTTEDSTQYLPLIAEMPVDLSISGIEVTQAIQDRSHSVPLVQGRPTTARIYAQTNGSTDVNGILASLSATRNGLNLGSLSIGPAPVSPAPSPAAYTSTFNVLLPDNWLSGQVTMTAEIDAGNAVTEWNEENNTSSLSVSFNAVPPLDLKLVPINYTHTPDDTYFPAYPADEDQIAAYLMKYFPLSAVNISYRSAAIDFTGNLEQPSEWSRLLHFLADVKNADGSPPSEAYYGLIPTRNADGDYYFRAFGGYGAIGWIRASVGVVEGGGQLAAHELGHNFGRRHAPCGNPAGPDPDYPYPDGSIGKVGLDVLEGRLWTPVEPDWTADFMSYCWPVWASDYTYRALYEDQRRFASVVQPASTEAILVRIAFDSQDVPTILPAYELANTPPTRVLKDTEYPQGTEYPQDTGYPQDAEYAIEFVGAAGSTIHSVPVPVIEAEERGYASQAISAVLPRPAERVIRLRLRREGQIVAERALNPPPAPAPHETAQREDGLAVTWDAPSTPALVRYTADGSSSWTTLGLDILGGELHVDRAELPGGDGTFEIALGR